MFFLGSESRRAPFVRERFTLTKCAQEQLRSQSYRMGFGGFGEVVYYRTYSRVIDGKQESWPDTVIRVTNGVMSIRKDWYRRLDLEWDDSMWQDFAFRLAESMLHMRWLPPGRGLYAMGTEHVYKVGAMPLFNCGATTTRSEHLADELAWVMDALMCGVGVGVEVTDEPIKLYEPSGHYEHVVDDSREGWVESLRALVLAWQRGTSLPVFDYSRIRPAGAPLRGIGGVASGYKPLEQLHMRANEALRSFYLGDITPLRLRADLVNMIGACVTMGDIRRSAEMLIGPAGSSEFLDLKDYDRNPERAAWGWASNNTIAIDHVDQIPWVARAITMCRGEKPGVLNRVKLRDEGDRATLINPCGEIPLEPRELCNVVEVVLDRCRNEDDIFDAVLFATFYASTVALLPTHQVSTNNVLFRNRRIGVSLTGIAPIYDTMPPNQFKHLLRDMKQSVRVSNDSFMEGAHVTRSCRTTTVKPSGTVSQIAGVTPGMHWAIDTYALRRIRVGAHTPIRRVLDAAGFKAELDPDSGAFVYAFPIKMPGRVERDVPLIQQFKLLTELQNEWADNSVSCTLKYHEDSIEGINLEEFLRYAIPQIKSLSVLAHAGQENAYHLPPYERISKEEFERLSSETPKIDWSSYNADSRDSKYCDGDSCSIV